ncbi:MAG: hypothetical protein ABI576_04940 [Flavobacterium sp.]
MKTFILIILLSLFPLILLKAQEKEKDTLFFSIDKYYTISPTITPNMSKQTYPELVEAHKRQMKQTQTNGYIYFIGNGYLTKNLKPKKILSIKDYIENRKFYFDGTHNKIIDKQKLEDSLISKYKIFFVNGNEFIQSRYLEYRSYYPLRDKDWNVIENKVKDTLFFRLDNEFINRNDKIPNQFYLKDSSYSAFYLEKIQSLNKLTAKRILSLDFFLKRLNFYNKGKTQELNDSNLWEYFNNYVIFLVEDNSKKTEYIQVRPSFAIE